MLAKAKVHQPDSDGKPMADNSKQFWWIFLLASNLAALYRLVADVWVGGDMLWYPKEDEETSAAPDVFVVFGRPKGHRGSYKQWNEDGIPLTVVFKIISKSNTVWEMADKLAFYDEHGVEEYYIYDPEKNRLQAYIRGRELLRYIRVDKAWTSPRLGIRFDLTGPEMVVHHPDGRRFLSREEAEAERVETEKQLSEVTERADRLASLTRRVLAGQASEAEREELQRLLDAVPV